MKSTRFVTMLILGSAFCLASAPAQSRERYTLHSRNIPGSDDKSVWLRDNRKHRVLWKRRLNAFVKTHWSKNRRALAIEGQAPGHRPGIFVWREGYRLRHFGPPGPNDFSMGCAWSPDNRRLLVRAGSAGAASIDYGTLFCLRLGRWPHYNVSGIGAAHKMAWRGRNTVIYWGYKGGSGPDNYDYSVPKEKPSFWRAP